MIEKIVVNPDETKKIAAVPGKDLVTLITCTPLGINTQRILVTGERVVPTPAADKSLLGKKPDVPRFPWWLVGSIASLSVVGGYIYWAGLPIVKKKKKKNDNQNGDDRNNGDDHSDDNGDRNGDRNGDDQTNNALWLGIYGGQNKQMYRDSEEARRISQESFESIIDGFAQGKRPKASKLKKLKT